MENDMLHVEYAPGGKCVSDFELDEFLDEVKGYISIVDESMAGGITRIRISTFLALDKLFAAVVCGEIDGSKFVFEFEGLIGTLDKDGRVVWPNNNWPRGFGDADLILFEVILEARTARRKAEREANEGVED